MIKIEERKYTTQMCLEKAKELLENINKTLRSDLLNFKLEKTFSCVITAHNGLRSNDANYYEWINTRAFLRYKNGYINLVSVDNNIFMPKNFVPDILEIEKLDFKEFFHQLQEILKMYNEKSIEKDGQIQRFLEIEF